MYLARQGYHCIINKLKIDLGSVVDCMFEGTYKPDDQWSCKRSPDIWYIPKYLSLYIALGQQRTTHIFHTHERNALKKEGGNDLCLLLGQKRLVINFM